MILFRAFGGLELRGHDGQSLQSVVSQPKRQALLVYLAMAGPRGFHRRDTLVGMLWPELDDARARAALTKAVHYLRASLGAEVLLSRGQEELGLDWQRFWCDATGFEDALERGEVAEALALYRGDVLPGFFVEDAPEFEQWLERQRTRLRDGAVRAAQTLSEREAAIGQILAAVDWARRATALAPYDESAVRRLMLLLESSLGRAAALRTYEEFADRLDKDLGLAPAAETQALRDAMRARDTDAGAVPPARVGVDAASPSVPPASITPSSIPAATMPAVVPAVPASSRRLIALAAVFVVMGVWLLWATTRGGRESAVDTGSPITVAMLPLDIAGRTPDSLATALVDGLVRELERNGRVRTIAPRKVRRALTAVANDVDTSQATVARAVARGVRAQFALIGRIDTAQHRVHVRLALLDTAASQRETPVAGLEADLDQMPALAADLAFQLLAVRPGSGQPILRTFPSNMAARAIEHYRTAMAARAAGRFEESAGEFRQAISADSTFALAYYEWSRVASWMGDWEIATWAIDAAVRHRGTVPLLDQFRIEAWHAFQGGRPVDAERLIRTVHAYRADADIWFTLGEVLFHWGPALGWTIDEARSAFEHAMAMEPHNVDALVHRARIAALEDTVTLQTLVIQGAHLPLDRGQALELRALHAFTRGTFADRTAILLEAERLDDRQLLSLMNSVSVYATLPERARVTELLRAPQRDETYRAQAALLDAQIAMSDGQWSDAVARLDTAEELDPARRAEYHAAFATLPFIPASTEELRALRARLEAQAPAAIGPDVAALSAGGIFPPRYDYLLALLSLRLEDDPAVERYLEQLDAHSRAPDPNSEHHQMMARIVRAARLHASGDHAQALTTLGPPQILPTRILPSVVDYPQAHERFLRAELLLALGREREALRWYNTFPEPGGSDLAYLAPSLFRRAQIQQRLGLSDAARASRTRADARWRTAEPGVRAWAN